MGGESPSATTGETSDGGPAASAGTDDVSSAAGQDASPGAEGAEAGPASLAGYGGGGGRSPRVVAGPAVVAYGSPFGRDEIAAVVHREVPAIRQCSESAPAAEGERRVVVLWTITTEGSVESARIESSTLGDEAAERCIVDVVRRLRFSPRHRGTGGTVQVRYPFVFSAPRE